MEITDVDELVKLKIKLKNVEREFLATFSRKPTKEDIKSFSPEIQELYKQYTRLKFEKDCNKRPTVTNPADIWGAHLNKCNAQEKKADSRQVEGNSTNNVFSKKLRANAQILRRNDAMEKEIEMRKEKAERIALKNHDIQNGLTINCMKPKFRICTSVISQVKSKPVNLFRMNELTFPNDDASIPESSFDVSQPDCNTDRNSDVMEPVGDYLKSFEEQQSYQCDILEEEINTGTSKGIENEDLALKPTIIKRKHNNLESDELKLPKRLKLDKIESLSSTKNLKKGKKTAASQNYVRINLKKKVYCRGKKKFNYKRYKLNKWKELKQTRKSFKEVRINKKSFQRNSDSEESAFETYLEEAECHHERKSMVNVKDNSLKADSLVNLSYAVVEPYYNEGEISQENIKAELNRNLKDFGYDGFRPGQMEAIQRVLSGLPALVIQPTGAGKSLCYLLPALMYARKSSCITLVISPLVSLMEDQLSNVPACLRAACLHTSMTDRQREKIRSEVAEGNVELLFISPESLVGGAGSPFGCLPPTLPPIAFVCIDEVHCVSTWSHNFRPCYLRLCHVVRDILGVKCILGLTATATLITVKDISHHIGIKEETTSIMKATEIPPNLCLSISRDHNEKALLELLQSDPFVNCDSIIIYCIRRQLTERLAILIRTYFQEQRQLGDWTAEPYHAGLTAARRRVVQRQFMQGKLRVMVATVAFGMGINKMDVRAIIHYDLPKSMESYVQEIGRAGRDGLEAHCHMFLDMKGEDRQELKRHIYSDTVDRGTVRKLLECVFAPSLCNKEETGNEVAFPVEDTVTKLDLKQEGIQTLLCYLELHPDKPIEILNCTYGTCKIYCYSETSSLREIASKCPAIALALQMKKGKEDLTDRRIYRSNMVQFPLVKVANILGCGVVGLRRQLKKLQWEEIPISEGGVKYQKTGVVVEFSDLCFHLRTNRNFTTADIDIYIEYLHQRIISKEISELEQLQTIYETMNKFSFAKFWQCESEEVKLKSQGLKEAIHSYFNRDQSAECSTLNFSEQPTTEEEIECVRGNVRQLLSLHHENRFTGRAVARIFHGISSPNFSAETWGRVPQFWRRHLNFDFNRLCSIATEELLNRR